MDINFTSMFGKNLKENNYSASPKKDKKVTDIPESPKSECTLSCNLDKWTCF